MLNGGFFFSKDPVEQLIIWIIFLSSSRVGSKNHGAYLHDEETNNIFHVLCSFILSVRISEYTRI